MSVAARRLRRSGTLAVLLGALGFAPSAGAIPPGGVVDNPGGAVVTVSPNPVDAGGLVQFTGTGFTSGEDVSVKIDDGTIYKAGVVDDVLTVVTATSAGTVSGSISLAAVNASTPVNAGDHWLRLLSAKPRSVKSTFTVVGTAPGSPTPTPSAGTGDSGAGSGGTTTPATGGSTTPAPTPALIALSETSLKVQQGKKLSLRLAAGTAGSSGRFRIRTLTAYKVGKGKAKIRDLVGKTTYFVDKLGKARLGAPLTKDGRAVVKSHKAFKAVIEFTDATNVRVKQTITIRR